MGEMSKSPEEIKKGLELCVNANSFNYPCDECPYVKEEDGCNSMMVEDALAYIQQLEQIALHWQSSMNQVQKALQDNGFGSLEEFLQAFSQVKADNAKKDETIQMLQDGNASLMDMIDEGCEKTVRLERERDTAVADLYCNWKCAICKRFTKPIDKCPHYGECGLGYSNFEWRGVPEPTKQEGVNDV